MTTRMKDTGKADKASITELVGDICGAHGDGTALVLGSDAFAIEVRGICPSGIATWDAGTGRWGAPYGRLTMLSGNEGSGKTTLGLHLVAECQKRGGIAMYQDMEYKLDPDLARKIGVDLSNLIISQPPHLEACLGVMETTIMSVAKWRKESGHFIPVMIVLDSINAALAKCELEGDYDDSHYAPQARVMSLGLKKLIPLCAREMVALVFISQLREKVGVMFGKKSDTAAGKAPKFYSSLIAEIRKSGSIKVGEKHIGNEVSVYFGKNQIGQPFKTIKFNIMFGTGVDVQRALMDQAVENGLIKRAGAWFSYDWKGKEIKWQGANKFPEALAENEGLEESLRDHVYTGAIEVEATKPTKAELAAAKKAEAKKAEAAKKAAKGSKDVTE